MTPMMDHHGQYGQGAMYGAPNYGPASGNMYNAQKRKQMRATQVCIINHRVEELFPD